MQTKNLPPRRPGNLPIRTVRAIVNRYQMPLVTKNEYGLFDVMLSTGEVRPAYKTLTEALAETPHPCIVHFPATGEFDRYERKVSIQCIICEGSGERSKWAKCCECDGRGERLYQDGYEGSGMPHWVSQPCQSCGGEGGTQVISTCGHCEGAGHVLILASSVLPCDTIVGDAVSTGREAVTA